MNAKLNWVKTQQRTLWRGELLLLVRNPHRRRGTQERPRNKGEDGMIAKTRNNNNIRQTQANNSSSRAQERHKQCPKSVGKAHDFIFSPFCGKYFENQKCLSVTNFLVFWGKKIRQKRIILIPKAENIATIVYNMKGCLKIFIDILLITPNLAKLLNFLMDDCQWIILRDILMI
jgi:hypothetical protein